ncbi:Disease resistance protein L6 [Linum perenne]
MDQQRFLFIWPLAALSLAVAVFFLPKRRPGISNGTSPSQSESPVENQPSTASTSSNSALPVEYEVFLSFRGPDVRANFADVLYKFLDRFKIRTFLDNEELPKGETIAPSLEKAIKESKVYVPILSQDYASSKWCLQELALMVKCCKQGDDRIILPIFYMMEPRDVRHQEGSYKKAFQLHSKKYDAETIKEWKEALKEVGEMKGWSVKESDRQGVIVDEVYSKVRSHLMRSYKLVTEDLVGIDSHVQQVTTLLSLESGSVKIVGIHAMGGMGKTTIAKAVYDQLYSQFDRFCFVEDAREILSKSDGVVTLQNKIISSILITDYKVKDASEGLRVINDRVCKYKVLVVLDDVNDLFEFDQTLGKLDNFSHESRFIFTTSLIRFNERNEFWMHDHIRDLGRKIVREEDSQRSWKRSRIWSNEDALDILRNGQGSDRVEVLRVDVEDENFELTDKEFKKLSRLRYLEVCYGRFIGDFNGVLPNLRWLRLNGCTLIPNDLNMKKLVILEMIYCPVEDEWRGWSGIKVASNLKAIHLQHCDSIITAPDLSQCRNLEWIDLHDCLRMSGEIHIGNLLNNLKLLSFSETNTTKNLINLDGLESLSHLKTLNLEDCLVLEKLPISLVNLTKLQELSIKRCRQLAEVMGLERLEALRSLSMTYCPSITKFPDLSALANLKTLDIRGCTGLTEVLVIPRLESLTKLHMSGCSSVEEFMGIKNLGLLEDLKMSNCTLITKLPDLSALTNLETLDISRCTGLTEVMGFGRLESLTELNMSGCSGCTGLTEVMEFGRLESLTELNMSGCSSVEELPDLSGLRNVVMLDISVCNQLKELTGIRNLELLDHLNMRNCTSIKKLPDLSGFANLKTLDISGCVQLAEVSGIERLGSLKRLNMSDCSSVEELPDLSCLLNIVSLDISKCNQLKEVMGIKSLELLEDLVMTNCTSIKKLPDLSGCKKLWCLNISGCVQLAEVSGIERLESLKYLNMSGCSSVEELPDLSGLGKIESLDISECNQLKEVTGIESLELLEYLVMTNCTSIEKLPDLSCCKKLWFLDIKGCVQLDEDSGIDKLEGIIVVHSTHSPSISESDDEKGGK